MNLKRNGLTKNLGAERCGGRSMMMSCGKRECKNIGILARGEMMKSGKNYE